MTTTNYTTANQGRELVPEQLEQLFILPILAASQIANPQTGIRVAPAVGTIHIPMLTDATAGNYWLAESQPIPEADIESDELTLLRRGLKSLKMINAVSGELVRNAQDDALNAVGQAISQRAAAELDRAMIAGDGTGDTIVGLAEIAGITTLTDTPEQVSLDLLTDAITEARVNGAEPTHVLAHPRVIGALHKLRENGSAPEGQYLVQPSAEAGTVSALRGLTPIASRFVPYVVTPGADPEVDPPAAVTSPVLVYQASQQVVAYESRGASLAIADQTRFLTDETLVRFISRWDIGSLNAAGVVRFDVDLNV